MQWVRNKLNLLKTLEVRLPLEKVGIISYLLNFARRGLLILLSLQFATVFLYSMENLQSYTDQTITKNQSNFRQIKTIDRKINFSKNFYYVFVNASALNLRSGPGVNNSVLRVLPRGTHMFTLSAKNSKWLRVFTPNSFKGWVARKHVIFYQPKSLHIFSDKIKYLHSINLPNIVQILKDLIELYPAHSRSTNLFYYVIFWSIVSNGI